MSYSKLTDQQGQSTVEYLLLLVVVVSFAMAVFRSQAFSNLLGPDSDFMANYRKRIQYSYRFARPGTNIPQIDYAQGDHPSYVEVSGTTRFFTRREPEN